MGEGFFQKFTKAVLKKQEPVSEQVTLIPHSVLPLKEMLAELVKISASVWGQYAFSRDVLRDKISDEEKSSLTIKAYECGYAYADELAEKYGTSVPTAIARALGLEVKYQEVPADLTRVLFADFVEPNKITIYKDNLDKANALLKDNQVRQILGELQIEELILAHEIFHYLEERDAKSIFTRTKKVELWAIRPFHNRSTIRCLGEIAGMAFAERLLGLNYSPFVMDVFFVYGYSKEVATGLFNEIMEMTEERTLSSSSPLF